MCFISSSQISEALFILLHSFTFCSSDWIFPIDLCLLFFLLLDHICFLLLSLSGKFFHFSYQAFQPQNFMFFLFLYTLYHILVFSIKFDTLPYFNSSDMISLVLWTYLLWFKSLSIGNTNSYTSLRVSLYLLLVFWHMVHAFISLYVSYFLLLKLYI